MRAAARILRFGALMGLALMLVGIIASAAGNLSIVQVTGAALLIATPTTALAYIIYHAYKLRMWHRLFMGILTLAIIMLSITLALTLT